MKKRNGVISAVLAVVMAVTCSVGTGITARADTCGGLEPEDVYQPSSEEVIQDPILHWAVRSAMNAIKGNVTLTADMVGDKSVNYINYELCAHPEDFETEAWEGKPFWIENLEGLQHAKSLMRLDIAYTSAVEGKRLADLSPLSGLTQLQEVVLKQDGINDISALSNLNNLVKLDVSGNREIADVSVIKNMTKLESLNVAHNKIENVEELGKAENLTYLDISYNNISELPDLSKLKKVYFLDAAYNQLTDVSALSGMTELQTLNLSGNDIKDITPLANLLKLDKENTTLPDESKKDDLFAAIEVNKLFTLFNISKMTEADLANVSKTLDAYDALTEEQKTYIDEKRVEAARSNKKKVENGGTAEYYPEYDVAGERKPVLNRLEIMVVDKKGAPLADVEFTKTLKTPYVEEHRTVKTDSSGQLILKHTTIDPLYDEIIIAPAGNIYVAEPEFITYTVGFGNITNTVNGNLATGLEDLKFTLIPKEEYVDKLELEEALNEAKTVKESYKYTEDSYQNFKTALSTAQAAFDDADADADRVAAAAAGLKAAIANLEKLDILTELKLIVKDESGNLFTRPFKFQVRVPVTGAEAWNELSDAYTGAAYLRVSPAWEDGKVWEILACVEEPYDVDPFTVTIGEKDGRKYFKTVDGAEVDADFEKEVIVKLRADGAPFKDKERKPDCTVLTKYIEDAKQYSGSNYTPASFNALQEAITDAEEAAAKADATQNDYNAAAAALRQAESALTGTANKAELQKEINMQYSYPEDHYTKESWTEYQSKLAAAEAVYRDGNAAQKDVDEACEALLRARNALVARADKTLLKEKLDEAKALSAENYESGFEELQQVIAEAQEVYDNENALQSQVDIQTSALTEAMNALVDREPAEEEDYACYVSMFRAKVIDEKGDPVPGVSFMAWIGDRKDEEAPIISDSNGIISYLTYGPEQYGNNVYVRLADDRYTTENEHYFTVNNNTYFASIKTVNGEPYKEGIKLTYTLKTSGGDKPEPSDKVLSDETTFRARVVDEEGMPLDGVEFKAVPDDEFADTYSMISKEGVIEQGINGWDFALLFTVRLKEDQDAGDGKKWSCETVHMYRTDGNYTAAPKITEIDGIPLAESGEIIFELKKSGGGVIPSPVNRKELETQLLSAVAYENAAEKYTPDSYAAFKTALEEARKIYGDMKATQEQIDAQVSALAEAVAALVEKAEPSDKILSDGTTFRAKVVDEAGNPLDGITFKAVPDEIWDTETYTMVSKEGVIEQKVNSWDYGLIFTVSLEAGQDAGDGKVWSCESVHTYKTDAMSRITEIDGALLAEAGEVVFELKKSGGGSIPEVVNKKELEDQIFFAASYEGKAESYTPDSYTAFETALADAKKVSKDTEATQEQVDEAARNLKNAREGLTAAEKPAVCDMHSVRIQVMDADGNRIKESIPFSAALGSGYPITMNSRNGVVEYDISTADYGAEKLVISLKDDSVILDGKEYTVTPKQHEFTIDSSSFDVMISKIDGEPLEGTKEVKFVLKEKEAAEVVDKGGLEEKIQEMKQIAQGNYTKNSYNALQSEIERAEAVYNNADAAKEVVEEAILALDSARNSLREVTGMRTLTIPVTNQDGSAVPVNTKFVRYDVKYMVDNSIYVRDGGLVWQPGSYDGGDYEIYLPDESAYIATPGVIQIHVGDEDGTPVIDMINGQPAAEGTAAFILSPKGTDSCDLLTFRALVQDMEGNALEGILFDIQNGDPNLITSDANGMIQYAVTSWDTDTSMTVSLKEGQGWLSDQSVTFTVITDPSDSGRGIIGTINDASFTGSEKIIFRLSKETEVQEADKAGLQRVMEEAGKLDETRYTEESFRKVKEELGNAVRVLGNEEATQEEVDGQVSALENAIAGLVKKPLDPPTSPETPTEPTEPTEPTTPATPATPEVPGTAPVSPAVSVTPSTRNVPAASFAARVIGEVIYGDTAPADTVRQERTEVSETKKTENKAVTEKVQEKTADPENKKIEDEEVPLASGSDSSGIFKWIPVICIILAGLVSIIVLLNKKREREK